MTIRGGVALGLVVLLAGCGSSPAAPPPQGQDAQAPGDAGAPRDAGGHKDGADARGEAAAPTDSGAEGGPKDSGSAGVHVELLYPPPSGSPDFNAVQTYLTGTGAPAYPYIDSVVLVVAWSDFDLGDEATGTHTSYDFSIPDAEIKAWTASGKKANLVLQNTTYGGTSCPAQGTGSHGTSGIGNCAMPGWVWTALGASGYVTCGSGTSAQRTPDFFAPAFKSNYEAAIAAFLTHYGSSADIGYIRVGLGKGGEINLPSGWDDTTTACGQSYTTAWGTTVGADATFTWNAYLSDMLLYEAGLGAKKQLMVSITPVAGGGATPDMVPDFLAPIAAAHGVGFGSQGLQAADIKDYPSCAGDWCNLFAKYTGQVPLELQTYGASCPAGVDMCPGTSVNAKLTNATGSLVPLLSFGVERGATIFELYYSDWLVGFDPMNPDYGAYGSMYANAIESAAKAK